MESPQGARLHFTNANVKAIFLWWSLPQHGVNSEQSFLRIKSGIGLALGMCKRN